MASNEEIVKNHSACFRNHHLGRSGKREFSAPLSASAEVSRLPLRASKHTRNGNTQYGLSFRWAVVAFFGLWIATAGSAVPTNLVTVTHRLSADKARPGDSFQVAVVLEIAKGWHIQAAKPTFDYLVPTELTLTPEKGIQTNAVSYPAPTKSKLGDDTLDVLEGQAVLRFKVSLPPDFPLGSHVLRGKLTFQPCDDQVCLAPQSVNVGIPFEVVAPGTPVSKINTEWFQNERSAFSGTLLAFLAIFFLGLLLNLTPCVYPMLSVTVSIFGAQSDTKVARVFFKAVVYVLGMATMYSLLGCAAAFSEGLFGSALQNRWVLLGIAALFVGLALSMFGLYELRLPSALMSRLGGATAAGLAGIYLSGLLVGIFAAPCVGPPVIALLVEVGKRGDPWFGFLAFFTLSLGLGAPYLVLGTFSGLLQKLPRSGVWMEWVKKVLGVVLLGFALFYLSLAFLPELVKWVPPITLILGGVYLGFIDRVGNDKATFRKIKWLLGGASALAGVVMFATEPRITLDWEPFHPDKLAAAKASGKPVILDFYADWCIPCHELDRETFSNPKVMEALKDHVRLKVDLTDSDSPESQEVTKRFGIQGVPTVIRLGPDGNEAPNSRVVGFLPAEKFLQQTNLSDQ